jgi:phage portal protein BeeE
MRLIDRIVRRSLDDTYPYSHDFGAMPFFTSTFGSPDRERILPDLRNIDAYATNSVVFACILRRINLFAEGTFAFEDTTTGKVFTTSALDILHNPWPNGDEGELRARMEQDASLAGNSYTRGIPFTDRLERLRPDWTTVISVVLEAPDGSEYREVVGYWYSPIGDPERGDAWYDVSEIAHWSPIPDPRTNFLGISWLTPAMRDIAADQAMTDYKTAYLENAATPNLVVRYPAKSDPVMIERLKAEIKSRYGGVRNAFKSMVLDEGADLTVVGSSLDKMAFTAVQQAGENRIVADSGVPPMLVGIQAGLDASTLANFGMAWRTFADGTIRPNWKSASSALAKLVKVPAGSKLIVDPRQVRALQEGEKERADTLAVQASAMNTFITAGFTPESSAKAAQANDIGLLEHSGLISVQLQPPGTQAPDPTAAPAADPTTDPAPKEGDA